MTEGTDEFRDLFAAAESLLSPSAPPFAAIARRAARRRLGRRRMLMGISTISAAAAVVAVVLLVNLAGSPAGHTVGPGLPVGSAASASVTSSPSASATPSPSASVTSSPSASATPSQSGNAPSPSSSRLVNVPSGSSNPLLSLEIPDGWDSSPVGFYKSDGTQWIDPQDHTRRIAVVSVVGCSVCMQNASGQWDVESLKVAMTGVNWTSVSGNREQGYFTVASDFDPFTADGAGADSGSGQSDEPYVGQGFAQIFSGSATAVQVYVWGPTSLEQQVFRGMKVRPAGGSVGATALPPVPPVTAPADVTYSRYTNQRFGFSVDIPTSFVAQPPPADGDGMGYTSDDGLATLTVFGQDNVTGEAPSPGPVVSSSTYDDNGREMVSYSKTYIGVTSEDSVEWTYPVADKDLYESLVAHTAASFQPGDVNAPH